MAANIAFVLACLFAVQAEVDFEPLSDGDLTDVFHSRSERALRCVWYECNRFCRVLGHVSGSCINHECTCREPKKKRSVTEERISQISGNVPAVVGGELSDASGVLDVVKSRSARSTCGYDECNRFCRKLGHARGVCIGTYCQCRFRRRRSLPEAHDENINVAKEDQNVPQQNVESFGVSNLADLVLSRQRRSCGAGECNRHCKKLGHARGVCIGTYCQCRSR